jgi:D-alanine-D-alanine ligase
VKVVVLSGGRSSEHDVSLRSGAAVADGLAAAGHEVIGVLIDRDGRWLLDGKELEITLGRGLLDADAVFPVLHGPNGEDGTVQGALDCLDVAYVGSGVLGSAICIDKITFKQVLDFHQVPQVGFAIVDEQGWRERAEALGLPLWVKPSRLGSSVGISRVTEASALDEAVELARRHDPRVIIEANSGGREIECSVIGNDDPETSVPGEIVANAEWYDYEAKYEPGGMELKVPAPLPDEAIAEVRDLAARVFSATGCSGLARCDFFVTEDDRVMVNELNTIPGFTETSVFAKLFEATGVGYTELCDRLVQLAIERHEREQKFEF